MLFAEQLRTERRQAEPVGPVWLGEGKNETGTYRVRDEEGGEGGAWFIPPPSSFLPPAPYSISTGSTSTIHCASAGG